MKSNSIEKSFKKNKMLKIDFQNYQLSWTAKKVFHEHFAVVYTVKLTWNDHFIEWSERNISQCILAFKTLCEEKIFERQNKDVYISLKICWHSHLCEMQKQNNAIMLLEKLCKKAVGEHCDGIFFNSEYLRNFSEHLF